MRHLAAGEHLVPERALGAEREAVFRWFAVDQILRTARRFRGEVSPRRVALLADYEQQSEIANAAFDQRAGRGNHRGDDALGIACAAAPDVLLVLARAEERRDGIHVGGKRYRRPFAETREHIVAARLDLDQLHRAASAHGQRRKELVEVLADALFVVGDRFDVDQRAREFKYVHSRVMAEARGGETTRGLRARSLPIALHPFRKRMTVSRI